jgi:hypothetical protein
MVTKIVKFFIGLWYLPIAYPTLFVYQLHLIKKITEEGDSQDLIDADDPDKLQDLLEPHCKVFMNKHEVLINSLTLIFWLTILRFIIFF